MQRGKIDYTERFFLWLVGWCKILDGIIMVLSLTQHQTNLAQKAGFKFSCWRRKSKRCK